MDDSTPGELKDDANAIMALLKAHPRTSWFVGGFLIVAILGLLV